MKKLMLLGGSEYLLPVIKTAKKLGCYTITCDYLPNNIAHRYSDEYCNVSVTDKEKVLDTAKKLKIDGIMSFACDPGVVTAAYVAEKIGLPFQGSYKSTKILQDKGLFRDFLSKNNFNCPHAKKHTNKEDPFKELECFDWPIIVKPVDSAGSKGVTRVDDPINLKDAIDKAIDKSQSKAYIIEDFLTFEGYHSSADVFTVDGELKFSTYSDQLFDVKAENPYTPSMIIWPSTMKKEYQEILTKETQRLMNLLDMKTGIYNVETCVGIGGIPYIMEVSPRGGGCKIAEIQQMAFGTDLIENEIRSALNMPLLKIEQNQCEGYWCETVIHSQNNQSGIFEELYIEPDIREKYVKLLSLSVEKGDKVMPFTGANMSLGNMFLRFSSRKELDDIMSKKNDWLQIKLQK